MSVAPATAGLGAIIVATAPPGPGLPVAAGDEPLVRRAARTAVDVGLWPVVVVLGPERDDLRSALAGMPLVTVRDPGDPEGGAGALRAGLKRLRVCCPELRGAFVLHCGPPFADEKHLGALARAARREQKPIAATIVNGEVSEPAMLLAEIFPELAALQGDADASALARSDPARVARVALHGAGGPLMGQGMGLAVVGKAHEAEAGAPFTWFVYGSSLDRPSFEAWARDHGYEVPSFERARPAMLHGYRLAFDVASRSWGGAVASLVEAPGEHVEGLAVPMPGVARGLVEHKEGVISGLYTALSVTVSPVGGGAPISAIAFRAATSRRLAVEGAPVPAYLDALVRGARSAGLSQAWLERLAALSR